MINESCSYYERYACTPSSMAEKLYYYAQWAGHFVCRPDFYIDRNSFQSILILQTIQGKGHLNYRGAEYNLNHANFALIDCRDPHYPSLQAQGGHDTVTV